jgi:hypothetical protein
MGMSNVASMQVTHFKTPWQMIVVWRRASVGDMQLACRIQNLLSPRPLSTSVQVKIY